MKRLYSLMMSCAVLFAFFVISVEAQDVLKPKGTTAEKIMTNKTHKAKPVEMPEATSKRDQVSAAGYHDKEEGEETQEFRPNPLDKNASQAINPIHDPVAGPR
ncbi:MAG TPA: hypothetical protein DCR97_07965 [Deltaproteobacteria bacterium]|nr:hypothetical protein [Deltaproteobacteria bacterium]